ncbi:hypothetical protein BJN34_04715 [Cupriavidus necator]|uniref:Uncharacterized protein n=1 Tax=Cupriavidus necator TaxID=106590 RepID=A0A1U9UKN4_CUPNE|nr:hypothetical protein [Cupriavidus necator]AQV93198.1 hypothetical protein BJN34_04715 [Cupriavidus necator]
MVFWGFYTWSPKISRIRAERHLLGYKSRPATTPEAIAEVLAKMDAAPDMGQALAALAPISQLSREPFASKVVAKRYPERAGIKDTQLYKGLRGSPWSKNAPFLRLGGVQERRCQDAFLAWCDFLAEIANQLNAGIEAGLPWHWKTREGLLMRWRPIDVERAIFKYYLLKKSNPLELRRLLEDPLLVLL